MKLLVVISLMLTLSHVGVNSPKVRHSEPITLTVKQKSDIVNKHNSLRAQEGASDMEMMTWNESLAMAAARWVAKCIKGNGYPALPNTGFIDYGQNILLTVNGTILVGTVIPEWSTQKQWYVYDTLQCRKGKRCNSYTQMVWATARQIGCAHHYCETVSSSDVDGGGEYIACNYVPAGNEEGQKPFKKGPPCSQCESGAGWCKDNLCNSQCTKAGKDCTCMAICYNCATLNRTTCRCSCAKGWTGPDCSERCEDGNKLCKPDPNAKAGKCPPVFAAEANSTPTDKPIRDDDDDDGDNAGKVGDNDNLHDDNHQQQCTTVTVLSNVILSLTITWKALL